MRTLPSFYLAGFCFLAVILGLLLKSWVLLVLSISSLSILIVGMIGKAPTELDLEISREMEDKEVYEGDSISITTTIKNNGDDIRYLEVLDELSPRVDVIEGSNHNILELKSGEEASISYKVECPVRGKAEIGPIKLRYRDTLDLFCEEWVSEEMMTIKILPNIEKISNVYIRPKYTRNWLGNIKSGTIGLGSEFFSLRDYVMGDSMKRINWKATARHLSPITNEYEGEKSGDVIIVVDAKIESNIGTVENNTNKACISAAASLASSILEDRNRVGMVIMGDFLNWVYPGFGRQQFHKIMDSLAIPTEGGVWEFEDAKWVINRFFKRKSMVIIISPLIEQGVVETVVDLWRGDYEVMVVSPSPVALEKREEEIDDPIAEDILLLERENIIERIWQYAVVVDWDPHEPLDATLEVVRRYQRRRNI